MQFRNFALLVAAACVVSAQAQAQEAPRFTFVYTGYLIENTAQGKRVFAEAQILERRLMDELRAKAEEIQGLEQQLRSSSLSEDGRGRITRQLEDGRITFNRMQEDSQAQYQRAFQAAMQQFETEIIPIIEAVATEQKLQVVLQANSQMIAWVDTKWSMGFTEEVAKRYDAAFPGTGTAATRTNAPNSGTSESGSRSVAR